MARDDRLAKEIGLIIDPGRNLPDLIFVDLEPEMPLLVFVEVVANDWTGQCIASGGIDGYCG